MSLKLKGETDSTTFDNLTKKMQMLFLNYHVWLPTLNMKLLGFWICFCPSLTNMKKKNHNMFFKMLDPRFKTYSLVSSLIGHEQGKPIIEKYDRKSISLCF